MAPLCMSMPRTNAAIPFRAHTTDQVKPLEQILKYGTLSLRWHYNAEEREREIVREAAPINAARMRDDDDDVDA